MPFSLLTTLHIFSKTAQGDTQRVKVKKSDDKVQMKKIDNTCKSSASSFSKATSQVPHTFTDRICADWLSSKLLGLARSMSNIKMRWVE